MQVILQNGKNTRMSKTNTKPRIIANMASFPPRINTLRVNLANILPQVDLLNVYLNEYDHVPNFLYHPKINAILGKDNAGDIGDVGKFYLSHTWHKYDAYIFTMDDKLDYPPDYVTSAIKSIEKYDRKAVISYHGRILKEKCSSYYFDPRQFFGVLGSIPLDVFVHEIGTGAMAFHSSRVRCNPACFKHTNMTDIYFSMFLQHKGIPMVVAAHKAGWVRIVCNHNDNHSIHAAINKDDSLQTQTVNSFQWKINKI